MFLYRRLRLTKCPIGQVAPLYLGPVCEGQKKEKKPKPSPELDFQDDPYRSRAGVALVREAGAGDAAGDQVPSFEASTRAPMPCFFQR